MFVCRTFWYRLARVFRSEWQKNNLRNNIISMHNWFEYTGNWFRGLSTNWHCLDNFGDFLLIGIVRTFFWDTVLNGIARTIDLEGGLLIGIARTIDFGYCLLIGIARINDLEGGLIVGIVGTIDLGDGLLIGIVPTIHFGECPFIEIVRTIDYGDCPSIGIVWNNWFWAISINRTCLDNRARWGSINLNCLDNNTVNCNRKLLIDYRTIIYCPRCIYPVSSRGESVIRLSLCRRSVDRLTSSPTDNALIRVKLPNSSIHCSSTLAGGSCNSLSRLAEQSKRQWGLLVDVVMSTRLVPKYLSYVLLKGQLKSLCTPSQVIRTMIISREPRGSPKMPGDGAFTPWQTPSTQKCLDIQSWRQNPRTRTKNRRVSENVWQYYVKCIKREKKIRVFTHRGVFLPETGDNTDGNKSLDRRPWLTDIFTVARLLPSLRLACRNKLNRVPFVDAVTWIWYELVPATSINYKFQFSISGPFNSEHVEWVDTRDTDKSYPRDRINKANRSTKPFFVVRPVVREIA